ncbi:Transmembrane protein 184C [Fusarium culmorum]|uniref:Transmembrane protein 184C n=1 Tax=Fusarium culmorum TaxID=5516 RepID=A0A2T4GRI7_FUSCU|nr:Transmembrane protein 184C [Fusarium culmorum]
MTKCKEYPLHVDIDEKDLSIVLTTHGLLILIATLSCLVACLLSAYLIYKHAQNFTKPSQQSQVIRILFMVPVYSIACVCSIIFYRQHIYIAATYEFYESLVIAAFFLLLCQFVHVNLATFQTGLVELQPKPWIPPIRLVAYCFGNRTGKASNGQRWFNAICVGVLQFCVVKFLGALFKCITEAAGVYCEESNSASHAKIWVTMIEIFSLVLAMMCLLQFYKEIRHLIAKHQPMLKFLAIKLVIMVFYLQSFIFGFITKPGGPAKTTAYISYPSWAVGIPNTLLCIEMVFASVLHLYAFPYRPYKNNQTCSNEGSEALERTDESEGGYQGLSTADAYYDSMWSEGTEWTAKPQTSARGAVLHALGFKDILRGIGKAVKWFFVSRRRQH